MNEELQQKIIQYIDGMESRLDKAEGFVTEQAPLVAQEILNWHFYSNLFSCFIFLTIVLLVISVSVFLYNLVKKSDYLTYSDKNAVLTAVPLFSFLICVFFSCCSIASVYDCVKTKIAPRVVILEELKNVYRD